MSLGLIQKRFSCLDVVTMKRTDPITARTGGAAATGEAAVARARLLIKIPADRTGEIFEIHSLTLPKDLKLA